MKKLLAIVLFSTVLISCKKEETKKNEQPTVTSEKIISLNGAITEVLVKLGEENNIIGVDVTSNFPESLKTTAKDLGHVRSISAESIIALQPTVIYVSDKDMNPELETKLKNSGIKLEIIKQEFSPEGTANLITSVAKSLNKDNYQPIIDDINTKIQKLTPLDKKPKVLFIYARGAGNLMVAGKDTPLEKMITLVGAENATNSFSDFKPLTPEALLTNNPDYILMFDSGFQSIGGKEGLMKIEGISQTNAAKNGKIIGMEGQYLSGFGPRLGDAAIELNNLLNQ